MLMVGWLFYGSVRGLGGLFEPAAWILGRYPLRPEGLSGSLPSFLHAFALVLLTAGAFGWNRSRAWRMGAGWFLANLLWDLRGPRLDLPDLGAALVGALTATGLLVRLKEGLEKVRPLQVLRVPVLVLGVACMIASEPGHSSPAPDLVTHDPILLTYEEMRAAFSVMPARDIIHNGKIMTAGHLLFVNERFRGIHVIDNTVPTSPKRLWFIAIPGNADMSYKEGVLYADSTVDLVAVDVSGPPRLVKRLEDVFAWDPYQCVSDPSVRFPKDIQGYEGTYVVVGAKPRR